MINENWYIAALSNEVSSKPIRRSVFGKHYAIFRDKSGKASVLLDRCIHRGTKLSEGKCGPLGLSCPYHGWTYDTSGSVVSIPSEGPLTQVQREILAKRKWKVLAPSLVEQEGVIWIWCGATQPETHPWRFPFAQDKSWTHYLMVTDFKNNVENLVQNFMDVPHTVFVHSKWFRNQSSLKVPFDLQIKNDSVKVTYHQPSDSIGFIVQKLFNWASKPMHHTDEFIYPNLTRVDYNFGENGFIINSQCTPIADDQTRVYTYIAYRGNILARLLKPFFQFYTRRVIEQDVEIMNNQGSNLRDQTEPQMWKSTGADEIHLAITHLRKNGVAKLVDQLPHVEAQKERMFWI